MCIRWWGRKIVTRVENGANLSHFPENEQKTEYLKCLFRMNSFIIIIHVILLYNLFYLSILFCNLFYTFNNIYLYYIYLFLDDEQEEEEEVDKE